MKMKRALLSFFGVGFAPGAPGTFASGVAILVYLGMLRALGWRAAGVACAAVAVFFALVTVLAGSGAEAAEIAKEGEDRGRDPHWIVSDEVAGQLVSAMFVTWPWGMLAAFAGFRVLDVAKPFPISRLERLPGGWGILADDVAAGLAVAAALRLADWLAPAWELVYQ